MTSFPQPCGVLNKRAAVCRRPGLFLDLSVWAALGTADERLMQLSDSLMSYGLFWWSSCHSASVAFYLSSRHGHTKRERCGVHRDQWISAHRQPRSPDPSTLCNLFIIRSFCVIFLRTLFRRTALSIKLQKCSVKYNAVVCFQSLCWFFSSYEIYLIKLCEHFFCFVFCFYITAWYCTPNFDANTLLHEVCAIFLDELLLRFLQF